MVKINIIETLISIRVIARFNVHIPDRVV